MLGTGAIACLWAANLATSGANVTLIARDRSRLAGYHGITVETAAGGEHVPVTLEAADSNAPIDRLLVCTKAGDVITALAAIVRRLAGNATIVLLQNGMGFHEEAGLLLGSRRLYCGLSTEGAWCPAPFHVRHAGRGLTLLGRYPRGALADAMALAHELPQARLEIRPIADTEQELWRKLAVNCAINALTAVHRCPNGALVKPSRSLMNSRHCVLKSSRSSMHSATAGWRRNCRSWPLASRARRRKTARRCCRMYRPDDAPKSTSSTVSCVQGHAKTGVPCPERSTLHPHPRACSGVRRLLGAVLLCLPLTAWAAPQRVVSLNLCTDQLLLMLLPRERIVMLSQLATDARCRGWRHRRKGAIERFDGSVESIVRLAPDLILSGTLASRESTAALQRLGFPVRTIAMPESIAESLAFIEQVATLVGETEAGQALIAETRRRLDAVRSAAHARTPGLALIYLPNGLSPGAGTLRDELLGLAGWRNLTRELGVEDYGSITLEDLVLHHPQRVIFDASDLQHTSMAQQMLRHPALRDHIATRMIPTSVWICGGPQIADAAEMLRPGL